MTETEVLATQHVGEAVRVIQQFCTLLYDPDQLLEVSEDARVLGF